MQRRFVKLIIFTFLPLVIASNSFAQRFIKFSEVKKHLGDTVILRGELSLRTNSHWASYLELELGSLKSSDKLPVIAQGDMYWKVANANFHLGRNVFVRGVIVCNKPHYKLSLIDSVTVAQPAPPRLIILGTIQDGGSPHIGCNKKCCRDLWLHPDPKRKGVSIGLIDPQNKQTWLLEATPDMPAQTKMLKNAAGFKTTELPDGIFVTHAHIGHYTGLMYLGKEAINANKQPVYAMPRMTDFLQNNQPWKQLVTLGNIALQPLSDEQPVVLNNNLKITPYIVPHRDEFSETVGYLVEGPHKKALFIPDINKWNLWKKDIVKEIAKVDYAFIDGTFYDGAELGGIRDMSQIPHPFIVESMQLMRNLPLSEKRKVYFIHFNHTNPLLDPQSKQYRSVIRNGFHAAKFEQEVTL